MSAWSTLTLRERGLIVAAVVLLAGIGFLRLIWVPMQSERAALRSGIARSLALVEVAEAQVARADRTAPAPDRAAVPAIASADAPSRPAMPARITRSADAAGLTISRLDPEGSLMRVSVEETEFETMIDWIAALEADHGVRLVSIELDRRTRPGAVSARLTLEAT